MKGLERGNKEEVCCFVEGDRGIWRINGVISHREEEDRLFF